MQHFKIRTVPRENPLVPQGVRHLEVFAPLLPPPALPLLSLLPPPLQEEGSLAGEKATREHSNNR